MEEIENKNNRKDFHHHWNVERKREGRGSFIDLCV